MSARDLVISIRWQPRRLPRVRLRIEQTDTAEAAIARVHALHRKANNGETCVYCAHGQRLGYDTTWPCDTIRALNGADQEGRPS